MSTYRELSAAFFLLASPVFAIATADAADFRVDNAVYIDGHNDAQSQGVTIFYGGLVYDFLNDPAEVIVFDKAHRRFILLDISRHVRSEISIDDVQAFVNRVKQRLSGRPDPNVKWLADPSFDESFDSENSDLTLKSPLITYNAQLQSVSPTMATQYREFSDWYAQFNFALNPKSRPPFPRMVLNEAIDRHKGVAKEVHLSENSNAKEVPLKITSRHQLAVQLDSADMNRVAEARDELRNFQSVSFGEYRKGK